MPNFCGIEILTDNVRVCRQTARVNGGEDGYDVSHITYRIPTRKVKFIYIQNDEDTDIMTLKMAHKDTNEAVMDWRTNSTGQNIGWETYTQPDPTGDIIGNIVTDGVTQSNELTAALVIIAGDLGISF